MEAFRRNYPDIETSLSVAGEVSPGLSGMLWKLVELIYRGGSRGGALGALYNVLRSGRRPNEVGILGAALGRGVLDWVAREVKQEEVVVVDHPLLVAILAKAKIHALVYMHGELVAPEESRVKRADFILVPTEEVRQVFTASGSRPDSVLRAGLCLEPSLARQVDTCSQARLKRLHMRDPLSGVFYSSGAEPPEHCRSILRAIASAIAVGGKALVFARAGGRLEKMTLRLISDMGDMSAMRGGLLRLIIYSSISEEETLLAEVFAEVDYLVAPAHERTNWALGLGLPFFMIGPNFGSFAPLNWRLAKAESRAVGISSVSEAVDFGSALLALRDSGELRKMNQRAPGAIDGFTRGAEALYAVCGK